MASFSRYKSEGLIKEISINVSLACLLSLCDLSLGIWCYSVHSDTSRRNLNRRLYLQKREKVGNDSPVDRLSEPRVKKCSQNPSIRLKLGQQHVPEDSIKHPSKGIVCLCFPPHPPPPVPRQKESWVEYGNSERCHGIIEGGRSFDYDFRIA